MVGLGRVELPTNGLGNRCSIHLSYRPDERRIYFIPGCDDASNFQSEPLSFDSASVTHHVYENIFELRDVNLRLDVRGMQLLGRR